MVTFEDFWEDLQKGFSTFAETSLKDFKDEAFAAGKDFLEQSKEDIKLWTEQLATGQMSKEDFEWNVKGKKDVADLIILKQKGLAKAQVDKFTSGLTDIIISTAVKSFI
jgi:hypothetical protein